MSENALTRWALRYLAWWIVKRRIRQQRRKLIAIGVIGLVLAGAVGLSWRARSE
jgi:hypothetical protein